MKKERLSFFASSGRAVKTVFLILIAICFAAAVLTRLSLVKSISDFTDIHSLLIETNYDDDMLSSLDETRENLDNAEAVFIVSFTGERQSAHYSTRSTAVVTDVIKGDSGLLSKEINIYENNAIGAVSGKIYLRNFTVNNFMAQGKAYLVFLNRAEDYDAEYKKEKNIVLDEYVMADYYDSLFCLAETDSEILNPNLQNIVDYRSYQNNEYIVFSEKQKTELYAFKESMIRAYIKQN